MALLTEKQKADALQAVQENASKLAACYAEEGVPDLAKEWQATTKLASEAVKATPGLSPGKQAEAVPPASAPRPRTDFEGPAQELQAALSAPQPS